MEALCWYWLILLTNRRSSGMNGREVKFFLAPTLSVRVTIWLSESFFLFFGKQKDGVEGPIHPDLITERSGNAGAVQPTSLNISLGTAFHHLLMWFPWYLCHLLFQFVFYQSSGEMYLGGLHARRNTIDRCLTDPGNGDLPALVQCPIGVNKGLNMYWDFKQVGGFVYLCISISTPMVMRL